jgi:hypothetical protein
MAFQSIEPGRGLEAEWAARRAEARQGSADDRLGAVLWALRHGLTGQGVDLLHEAAHLVPDHAPTARLAALAGRLATSCPDPAIIPTITSGPPAFRVARSDHLLMLHQTRADEAEARLRVLEDVLRTYHLLMADLGLRLHLPRKRLVVVWFARQTDYRAFLQASNAGAFFDTEGYYHPTRHLMVFFDQRSTPRAEAFRASQRSSWARPPTSWCMRWCATVGWRRGTRRFRSGSMRGWRCSLR